MNIQIWGTSKSFDTKKAERYFKERKIKYQLIDVSKYGMSSREFDSVLKAVKGIDRLPELLVLFLCNNRLDVFVNIPASRNRGFLC